MSKRSLPGCSSQPDREEEDERETYLEWLPLEALQELFKRLPIEETVKLTNESSLLNTAVRIYLKSAMTGLRRNCIQVLPWLQGKLRNVSLTEDLLKFKLVRSITLVRYLSKEIELLFASVWRLRDDDQAWTELAPHVAPVIKEFDDAVSAHYNLAVRHMDLNSYRMRHQLNQWHLFLNKNDAGLEERLYAMASRKTPFEVRVIDLLMCAPSFNSQLALKRFVTGGDYYNIYGFFKTTNLKPICQVPNVFNVQLSILEKKRTLITYLRETVQRDNLGFLDHLSNRIHDLELALSTIPEQQVEFRLLERLEESYKLMQETPYAEVMKKSKYRVSKELYEEYYVRCTHENMDYTGLYCIVVAPRQEVWNLPLAVPFLRGRGHLPLDHFKTIDMDGSVDLSNLFPSFAHEVDGSSSSSNSLSSIAEVRGSEEKPRLQLIIHYRESYITAPSEVVVNIGYDDDDTCHLTFHNLLGPLLHPPDPQPGPEP